MSYPVLPFAFLPYFRLELPGWGRLMRLSGVTDDHAWTGAPRRSIRGKLHGYRMRLDLANWSERSTYFTGRFYDLPTQLLLRAVLRPGDHFVDVGTNIGMITLLAARLVGPAGRVVSFEPNPDAFARLGEALDDNGLRDRVDARQLALGDEPGEAVLSVVTAHTGMGTLAEVGPDQRHLVTASHRVRVAVGDDEIPAAPDAPPLVVKIDAEGFESRILRGLRRTLESRRPLVVAESVPEHLSRAGSGLDELGALMTGLGYEGHGLGTARAGLGHRLRLGDDGRAPAPDNIAWVHPDGTLAGRLRDAGLIGRGPAPAA